MLAVGHQATTLCGKLTPSTPPAPVPLSAPSSANIEYISVVSGSITELDCHWGSDDPGTEQLSIGIFHFGTMALANGWGYFKYGSTQADGSYVSTETTADPDTDYSYIACYTDLWCISLDSDDATADDNGVLAATAWRDQFPAIAVAVNQTVRQSP